MRKYEIFQVTDIKQEQNTSQSFETLNYLNLYAYLYNTILTTCYRCMSYCKSELKIFSVGTECTNLLWPKGDILYFCKKNKKFLSFYFFIKKIQSKLCIYLHYAYNKVTVYGKNNDKKTLVI